ncbi:BamA/TamA family outer membrane protein [Candidatus Cardinium hertigii]|nr:BamA/TamA family outer membrane protein [Candidatus Cardinium hertigii]
MKEVIVGVNKTHKKGLQKYSICQPPSTVLFIPLKRWLYHLGKRYFNPDTIKNDLLNIKNKYEDRINNAKNEKEKIKLIAKRDRLMKAKETILTRGNRLMRMGEKPIYYDPMYVHHNEKMFLNYLHSKGYLDGEVISNTDVQKKRVYVTYYVTPHHLYTIGSVHLQTDHKPISDILLRHKSESCIKPGHPYQYQDFVNEQERIINLLSNNGYFEFHEQYIYFIANVSPADHTIDITTVVDGPGSEIAHIKTKVGRVIVDLTCEKDKKNGINAIKKEYRGIDFLVSSDKYPLAHLVRKITIRPGDFYNKSKILETYERLHGIATFESITILPKLEEGQLVVYIHAKPNERVLLQTEFGGTCINLNLKRFRPTIKLIPTIRGIFGGMGIVRMETSVDWGGQLEKKKPFNVYNHVAYGLRIKFTTPRFICYLPEKTNLELENFNPSTAIDMDFIKNPMDMDSEQKIKGALHYQWFNRRKNISYQFSPCTIITTHPKIIDTIPKNPFEKKLFTPSFLTSIGFASTISNPSTIVHLSTIEQYKWMISIGLEHGGLYEYIFPIKKLFSKDVQFYKFIKFDIAYRHAYNLTQDTRLVYQAKLGIVNSYESGEKWKVHPDKQYEIGGHGSVRGWDAQMVGPGFYLPKTENKKDKHKGDLLLLGNIELRQKLIGHLEGALFLDIGNTWKLSKYHTPPKMRFYFNDFYKALAVGGGFGLRLNFYNTFVLCGDVAIQLHRPVRVKLNGSQRVNFNLSIGYPF